MALSLTADTIRSIGPKRSRQSSQRNKTSTLLPQRRQKQSLLLRLAPAPFALCALLRPLFRGRTAARHIHRLRTRRAGRSRALASSRVSRRSRPSARDSSGGRRRLQRKARRSRGVCSGCRSITPRSRHSPHRIGLNVQQVLELAGSVVSRVQAVRDNRNTLVQKQPQSFGGQLGQSQAENSRRQTLQFGRQPLRSQDRQQTSQPSCVQTWHRGRGYDRSCSEQGNAEPDCGKRTAEAQALSPKADMRQQKQVSWSGCTSGNRSARPTPDLIKSRARAEHQQGTARPAQRARRKPARGRPEARELPAPTGKN